MLIFNVNEDTTVTLKGYEWLHIIACLQEHEPCRRCSTIAGRIDAAFKAKTNYAQSLGAL